MTTRDSNPMLRRLDPLVGTWQIRIDVGDQTLSGGQAIFGWLEDEGVLYERADAEPDDTWPPEWVANSPMPVTRVYGLDDRTETFTVLYADARGVCRIYQTALDDGVWTMWGQAASDFYQRFEGRFSADGGTMTAYWEKSPDGTAWTRDFDLTYTRVG